MTSQDFPPEFAGLTEPYDIFQAWWDKAHQSTLNDANAFLLSTVDLQGQPHSRVVLAKEVLKDEGIIFYTNYESDKGQEIEANNKVAATFYWDFLRKQVRFVGVVERISRTQSEKYWESRPRSRQLSQWVSKQSKPVASRSQMEVELAKVEAQFKDQPIPCPKHWGGYLIRPEQIEFWKGQLDRFHDRIRFTKVEKSWTSERLYP